MLNKYIIKLSTEIKNIPQEYEGEYSKAISDRLSNYKQQIDYNGKKLNVRTKVDSFDNNVQLLVTYPGGLDKGELVSIGEDYIDAITQDKDSTGIVVDFEFDSIEDHNSGLTDNTNKKYYNFETFLEDTKDALVEYLKAKGIYYELSDVSYGWHFEILCDEDEFSSINDFLDSIDE